MKRNEENDKIKSYFGFGEDINEEKYFPFKVKCNFEYNPFYKNFKWKENNNFEGTVIGIKSTVTEKDLKDLIDLMFFNNRFLNYYNDVERYY